MTQPIGSPKTSEPRGCLPTLIVGLLIVGIWVAGSIASGALANEPPKPIRMNHGVAFTAPWEWEFVGSNADSSTIVLNRGNGEMAIRVVEASDPEAALQAFRDELTASELLAVSEISPVPGLRPGDNVQRFVYSGEREDFNTPVEGEVTAIAGDNYVVVFDATARKGRFVSIRDEVATMIGGATIP